MPLRFLRRYNAHSIGVARRCTAGVLIIVWSTFGALVLVTAVPDSPLAPSMLARINLLTVMPQGWAFFTRDPREPTPVLYAHGSSGWTEVSLKHTSRTNAYGFRRIARIHGQELAALLSQVPAEAWTEVAAGSDPVRVHVLEHHFVQNPARRPDLCSSLLVVVREPVPWAWARARRHVFMPGRMVRLEVSCRAAGDVSMSPMDTPNSGRLPSLHAAAHAQP